jgi:hypothetical protein
MFSFPSRRRESATEIVHGPTGHAGLWFQSQISTFPAYPIELSIRLQNLDNLADVQLCVSLTQGGLL